MRCTCYSDSPNKQRPARRKKRRRASMAAPHALIFSLFFGFLADSVYAER